MKKPFTATPTTPGARGIRPSDPVTITAADYRLLWFCKEAVKVANLIDADPEKAFDLAVDLPIEPETRRLRDAVVMHSASVRLVQKCADAMDKMFPPGSEEKA